MMPVRTRAQSKKPTMGSVKQEATLSSLGQSSPRPGKKAAPVVPASDSDSEQEDNTTTTTGADASFKKQSMDSSPSEASAQDVRQASPMLKRRNRERNFNMSSTEEQPAKNEDIISARNSKESLAVGEGSSRQKETISRDNKTRKLSAANRKQESSNMITPTLPVQLLGLVLVLFIVLLLSVYWYMYMHGAGGKSLNPDERQAEFERNMKAVKQDFQMQELNLWDVVEATVSSHLDPGSNPTQPIVLLLGSPPESSDTTPCLVKRLGEVLSASLKEGVTDVRQIDGRDYQTMNADDAKLEVDKLLQPLFDSGQKVAIILNLDALPPCSILLFHSYCDNDNARYTDVALIFTVTLAKEQLQKAATPSKPLSFKNSDAFQISDHLMRTWVDKCPKLPKEKVEAMLSRIANNVGIVKPEKTPSC